MNNAFIDKIEALCTKKGIKLTQQRKLVLEIMINANKAMSAYDLLDLLKRHEPQAKPPTIYRVLEFLIEHGFIHKVESNNSYIVCPHFSEANHTSVLLICDSCKAIVEKHSSNIELALNALAEKNTFSIQHSVLEMHGLCQSCQR